MTKRKKGPSPQTDLQKKRVKPLLLLSGAVLIAALLVSIGLVQQSSGFMKKSTRAFPPGAADHCKVAPAFPQKLGMQMPFGVDLRQKGYMGLAIIEGRPGGRILHLPEWEQAGFLGPHALDEKGNIYVAPVPNVNIQFNPPEKQNILYRVDSQSGKMAPFLELPWASPPTANNPFGLVGLTYDCDTKSLYAASVAGSTFREEVGRIFRIDLTTQSVKDQLEDVDAIGIGILNGNSGKRLYYGSARESEVYSIGLDDEGNFMEDKRFEFSLAAGGQGAFDKGHRIQFFGPDKMTVKAIEFSYSLIAASDPRRNIYTYTYNAPEDSWTLEGVQAVSY